MIRLNEAEVVASGSSRNVYRHPDNADLLIKVIRPEAIDERFGSGAPWYKYKARRYRHLIAYLREMREQIAVSAIGGQHPPFLQKIVGIVETDMGMGFVVEAVRGADGHFAPTVAELIRRRKLDGAARAKLEQFLDELVASPVIVSDLHASNVVLGHTPALGDHFVLIDGIGFKNVIPLDRMSGVINRWGKKRKASQFRAAVERRMAKAEAPERPPEASA